ncbi:hypothetical protein AT864_01494 [Anoxybacillus sp. P3H1B]|nr:hypothetical protein [Anoxybacillus sp. P3H1B]KXG09934.1 hypothetical protein AT864_01494 [Anoxybacillus sp. P3H1B]
MKLEVVDKATGKIIWIEEHETEELILQAIEELKKRNFNPDYFNFNYK